jgi:hypothetical protein
VASDEINRGRKARKNIVSLGLRILISVHPETGIFTKAKNGLGLPEVTNIVRTAHLGL